MGEVHKSLYLLMAVIVLAAPTVACALPGLAMSEEEKDCCLQMADQCGGSQMDNSHTCCQKNPASTAGTLRPSAKYSPVMLDYMSHAALNLASVVAPDVAVAPALSPARSESPPGHISVLRI